MQDFWPDVGFALRRLAKRPGMTIVALLTLALGIGANAAIFTVVNGVLLRPLPFRDSGRLVWMWAKVGDNPTAPFPAPDYLDYRERNHTFEDLVAESRWPVILTGQGDPERLQGIKLSGNGLNVLGARAALGRILQPEDDQPGAPRVVVISYGLWQRRFGGDPGILGKTIALGEEIHTVVGVLAPDFFSPKRNGDVYAPLNIDASPYRSLRDFETLWIYGRLRPGVSLEAAQKDMNSIAARLVEEYPKEDARKNTTPLVFLREEVLGDFQLALWVLLGAVGLVLLIACANLANLFLADAAGRHKEIAIRSAMGASRFRLIRQLLLESVVLSVFGGALGILLGYIGIPLLMTLSPANLPRAAAVSMDGRVLLFAVGLSLLTGILFGLAPSLGASKSDIQESLREGGREASEGAGGNRVRRVLVVAEVAVSLVLLAGAGLLLRSFVRLAGISPGFNPHGLLTCQLSVPRARMRTRDQLWNFYQQLYARLASVPGMESAVMAHDLPVSTANVTVDFTVVGRQPMRREEAPEAQYRLATPGYFRTLQIPIRMGREFTPADLPETQHVAVVNQTAVSYFWNNENPIGSHIVLDNADGVRREFEIVGVAGDVKQGNLNGPPTVDLYLPMAQIPEISVPFMADQMKWVVRTQMEPLALAKVMRDNALAVDPEVAMSETQTMEQYLAVSLSARRFNLVLLGIFAAAALFLAISGIYAVISYSVARRTHEFGIRVALGAQRRDVLGMILGESLRLLGTGIAIGSLAAFGLTRILAKLLYGVGATDPATFFAVAALLAAVGVAASLIPAARATRVDPLVALRYE
ncbi:MAG: ABC transporter permease [Candidatus Acidiferrales bacterium]